MRNQFRIRRDLLREIHADLERPHEFAHERVGFIACRASKSSTGYVVLAYEYLPVHDEHYVNDSSVGAMMGSAAIRTALQFAYRSRASVFHVHSHGGRGRPSFSRVDLRENARFIPDFFNVAPTTPHGAVVLSNDNIAGLIWVAPGVQRQVIDEAVVIGAPLLISQSQT